MNNYVSVDDLEAGVDRVRKSPKQEGVIELIICRPKIGERRELEIAELDLDKGLIGDNWKKRGFAKNRDGSAHPDMQINLMNSRAIGLIAKEKNRWMLAGDQFYVDLDLCPANVPPGTQLAMGKVVIEVTNEPHLACKKFAERFGRDAAMFANSEVGKSLNLRGINAKVILPGKVNIGSVIKKVMA